MNFTNNLAAWHSSTSYQASFQGFIGLYSLYIPQQKEANLLRCVSTLKSLQLCLNTIRCLLWHHLQVAFKGREDVLIKIVIIKSEVHLDLVLPKSMVPMFSEHLVNSYVLKAVSYFFNFHTVPAERRCA
jgi:hypothetical protein